MKLDVLQNGQVVFSKELPDGTYKIGRASECEVRLNSTQVSKQHALLVIKGGRAAVADLGSANGVFVNGILVKKQRVENADDVRIVDFQFRFGGVRSSLGPPPRRAAAGGYDGSAAFAAPLGDEPAAYSAPAAEPAREIPPQERFLQLMDEKILAPFFGVLRTADWRWVLASILLVSLMSSVLLSVVPVLEWGRGITRKEALQRAQTIVSQTVRENYRVLSKTNDEGRMTVEAAESQKGVLQALIVDAKNVTVLAPQKFLGRSVADGYSQLAVQRIVEGKEDQVEVQQDDNIWIVGQPIRVYSADSNDNELRAVVLVTFQVTTEISSIFQPMAGASLYAILFSLLAFFLIFKMIAHPISRMQQQLDAALRGESVTVTSEARLAELDQLASTINFAVSRIRQAGGGPADVSGGTGDADDEAYRNAVMEFDQGSSDGLLLLDRDKKVRYVGRATEELLSMRSQYAIGQNISDACRDPGFAGTAIDLSERVVGSIGESATATIDINGIARNLTAIGHKNANGEVRFVLLTIKLGGEG